MQSAELLPAVKFPLNFLIAKITWLPFELRDGIQARSILQEHLERLAIGGGQVVAEHDTRAILFLRQRLADRLLQKAIARRDDALLFQIMEEGTQDVDWLAAHSGRLLCFGV